MFIVARVSVDVHDTGVVVLGVFGLSGPVLAMVVVHVLSCTISVDVHVIGVVVLGVFGLSSPILAMVVVHVRSERYLMTPTSSG